jgi:hypothetical protein
MGEPLYAKLGFHSVGVAAEYSGVYTGSAVGVSRPAAISDISALAALDREVSGYTRDQFWERGSSRYSFRTAEFAGGPGLIGSRRVANGRAVGPIIAPTAADACALISDVVATGENFRVDTGDADVAAFLLASGFEARKDCALMVYGAKTLPGDRARYFGPASLALG